MRKLTRKRRKQANSVTAAAIRPPSVWRRSRLLGKLIGGLDVGQQEVPSLLTR